MPRITVDLLVQAVQILSQQRPLVRSQEVRKWCNNHSPQIDWGEYFRGRKGAYLEDADKQASVPGGRLQKWKRDPTTSGSAVGWSLPDGISISKVARIGWTRMHWDPGQGRWTKTP